MINCGTRGKKKKKPHVILPSLEIHIWKQKNRYKLGSHCPNLAYPNI